MKLTVFALALALLAGCATPNAYSGTARSSEETSTQAMDSTNGSGGAEPEQASPGNVFSTDDYQNQNREFEAWEAGGG